MALTKVTQHSLGNSAVTSAKLGTAPFGFANSSANVVYMAANGNIGIGTSTPGYKLQTKGDAVGVTSADGTVTNIINYNTIGTVNAADLAITANNATRMTVASNGNIGIGTTSPGFKLDVAGEIKSSSYYQLSSGSDAKYFGVGNALTGIYAATDLAIWNVSSGNILFYQNGAERMRIDSGGNLMIGQTTPNARLSILGANVDWNINSSITGGASTKLHIRFIGDSTVAGTITSSGTSVGYNSASDYRLKENITPMTDALALIMRQRPVTYQWKSNGLPGKGFIAHWMQEDGTGECVTGEKDAVDQDGNIIPQGVDTSFLVATLTAAIQELKAEFDAYKASHP